MESTIGAVKHMQEVWQTKKDQMDKKIEELKSSVSELKDGKIDSAVLDELVSAVRNRENVPYEVSVPLESVIKEYDMGSYHISRCRNCFVWKTANYRVIIEPSYNYDLSNNGGVLYALLTELCDIADKKENNTITDDERQAYDLGVMITSMAFSLPIMIFSDIQMTLNVYKYVMDQYKASLERASAKLNEETPEDIAANQKFEDMMKEIAGKKSETGKE